MLAPVASGIRHDGVNTPKLRCWKYFLSEMTTSRSVSSTAMLGTMEMPSPLST